MSKNRELFFNSIGKDNNPYLTVWESWEICELIALFCGYKKGQADFGELFKFEKPTNTVVQVFTKPIIDPFGRQPMCLTISDLGYDHNFNLLKQACDVFLSKCENLQGNVLIEFNALWEKMKFAVITALFPPKPEGRYVSNQYFQQQAAVQLAECIRWYNKNVKEENITKI